MVADPMKEMNNWIYKTAARSFADKTKKQTQQHFTQHNSYIQKTN